MYCTKCGHSVDEGEIFCTQCGSKAMIKKEALSSFEEKLTRHTQKKPAQDTAGKIFQESNNRLLGALVLVCIISTFAVVAYVAMSKIQSIKNDSMKREVEMQNQINTQKEIIKQMAAEVDLLKLQTDAVAEKPTISEVQISKSKIPVVTEQKNTTTITQPIPKEAVTNALDKRWHTVFSVKGESSKTTRYFGMRGNHWRLTYSCIGTSDFSEASGFIAGKLISESESFGDKCIKNKIYEFYDHSAGEYYFTFTVYNASFDVTIEDYY